MTKKILFIALFLYSATYLLAQTTDTLRILSYNLLYYRRDAFACNNTTNNPDLKDDYLRTLIDYENPDIFMVQEMGVGFGAEDLPQFLLHQNVFLNHGRSHFKRSAFTRSNNSGIVNAAYYDGNKLELKSQFLLTQGTNNLNIVRGIDFYSFYYKDPQLGQAGVDTVFIICINLHLKAGNTAGDILQREHALGAVMQHINNNIGRKNIFIMGDYNMKSSAEVGFQFLVNHSNSDIVFHDPVNALGNWFGNSVFAGYHTQSTRLSQTNNGCFVGGGLDDRLDMILMSDAVKDQEQGVAYVPGSYRVIGQDGLRFNSFLTSTSPVPNTSVPPAVLNALYNCSDHLPVRLDFTVQRQNLNQKNFSKQYSFNVQVVNPVTDRLSFNIRGVEGGVYDLKLTDITGKVVMNKSISSYEKNQNFDIPVQDIRKGVYILTLQNAKGESISKKIIKS